MLEACAYDQIMNKMLQVRTLKAETHKKAKIRAASEGKTLTDWAAGLIEREVTRPTHAEISARLREMAALDLSPSSAEIIRQDRDSR
jgi:antitoxin FitA